jgi:hypothetical protein
MIVEAFWSGVLEGESLANEGFLSRLAASREAIRKIPFLGGESRRQQHCADSVCTIGRGICQGMCDAVPIKRTDAPTLTASMRVALADLKLDQLNVVYPGARSYELGPQVTPIDTIAAEGIDGFLPARRSRPRAKRQSAGS